MAEKRNRNRVLALLAALMLVSGLVTFAHADTYEIYNQPFQVITTQRASVRQGPAAFYPEYTMLPKNSILTAYTRVASDEGGNDWFMVEYNGMLAYVSTIAAKIYGNVVLTIPNEIRAFWVVTTQLAAVKTGPASTYKELGRVRKNTQLTAIGRVPSEEGGNDWYVIFYEGTFAYISVTTAKPTGNSQGGYAGSSSSSGGSSAANMAGGSAYITLVTKQLAYIRTGPASTYRELGRVQKGKTLKAYRRVPSDEGGKDWFMIDYQGQVAYVSVNAVEER